MFWVLLGRVATRPKDVDFLVRGYAELPVSAHCAFLFRVGGLARGCDVEPAPSLLASPARALSLQWFGAPIPGRDVWCVCRGWAADVRGACRRRTERLVLAPAQ